MMFRCPKCGCYVKGIRTNDKNDTIEIGHCNKCNIDLRCLFGGYVDESGGYVGKHHVTGKGIDKTYTLFE